MSTSVEDQAGKMETVSEQAATVLSVWYQSTVAAATVVLENGSGKAIGGGSYVG